MSVRSVVRNSLLMTQIDEGQRTIVAVGSEKRHLHPALLEVEQTSLAMLAAAVASEAAVRADDAVAWNDDRDAIVAVRAAHRARRARPPMRVAIVSYDVVAPNGMSSSARHTLV